MFGVHVTEGCVDASDPMSCVIEKEWTGIMAFTTDEMPLIGVWSRGSCMYFV